MAVVDVLLDAAEVEIARQHIGKRAAVEQRDRAGARDQRDRGEPAHPDAGDSDRIGAVDVMDVKVLPYIAKLAYRGVEIVGEHRERCGIDRARRCAAKDGKRALFWVRQELS